MEFLQDALNWLDADGFVEQLNPANRANLAIYFASIFVWLYSTMAIWLAQTRRWRFFNIVLNQFSAVGVILSWTEFAYISANYWPWALGLAAMTLMMASYQFVVRDWFRRRREVRQSRAVDMARGMQEDPRLRRRP